MDDIQFVLISFKFIFYGINWNQIQTNLESNFGFVLKKWFPYFTKSFSRSLVKKWISCLMKIAYKQACQIGLVQNEEYKYLLTMLERTFACKNVYLVTYMIDVRLFYCFIFYNIYWIQNMTIFKWYILKTEYTEVALAKFEVPIK